MTASRSITDRIVTIRTAAAHQLESLRHTIAVSGEAAHANRLALLVPILIIAAWWVVAYAIYATGWPIPYSRVNLPAVTGLVAATTGLSLLGFALLTRQPVMSFRPVVSSRPSRFALMGLALSFVMLIVYSEFYSGFHLWEIGAALADQGRAYELGSDRIAEGTTSRVIVVAIQTLAAPLTMTVVPYFALAWFERRRYFWLFVASVAIPVCQSVLVARDFQLALTAILLVCAWMIARVRRRIYFRLVDAGFVVVAGVVFLVAFGARKMSRNPDLIPLCAPGSDTCVTSPTLLDYISVAFGSYASQSFEGLGRALLGDWAFGGGLSHAPSMQLLAGRVFGPDMTVVITDQLVEHGWHDQKFWSTGLSWLANDVPWVVVPLVVAVQAVVLAAAWVRSLKQADAISLAVFSYSWLSLFFVMQNLQLAQSGPLYVGYVVLVAIFVARGARERVRERRRATPKPSAPVGGE